VIALIDRHHDGLFYSLQLLFEDRLGGTVYTPIGHDWWDSGIWRFGEQYGDDRLARQFLDAGPYRNGIAYDPHHPERPIHGITLDEAREMPWEYVVATAQDNQTGFKRFADEVGAKFVLAVGNRSQFIDWNLDPLALISSEVDIWARGIRVHQEFEQRTFGYRDPAEATPAIRSFINCFDSMPCSRLHQAIRPLLPEFTFGVHGIDGADGNIETVAEIADLMASSAFGYHDKEHGDGFGHIVHDWASIGRPLIGHRLHYEGLMAENLWQDGVTCIDLANRNLEDSAAMIRDIWADKPRYRAMCQNIRAEFNRIDYDAEAEQIRDLLGMKTGVAV